MTDLPIAAEDLKQTIYIGASRFGRGVFAGRQIGCGEQILMFRGPEVSFEEALYMGTRSFNLLQIGLNSYLDIEEPGVLSNHSCEPNSGLKDGRFLIALRDIEPGEEIVWDYSTSMHEKLESMKCDCRTARCRHLIGDFIDLSAELQEHYLQAGLVSPFILADLQNTKRR